MRRGLAFLPALVLLAACHVEDPEAGRQDEARGFPRADRPAMQAGPPEQQEEAARDAQGEAAQVMGLAGIAPGMSVADVGAGEGYYTMRLARRVGRKGRVLAEDIDPDALGRLGDRVQRERMDNVAIKLGHDADPHLPANSFDRIFLVDTYHEVHEPYAFLWHLRTGLRPGGALEVVEADRPLARHGIMPLQLICEMASVGWRLTKFLRTPAVSGYYAEFKAAGERPSPSAIHPCCMSGADKAARCGFVVKDQMQ